MRNALVITAFCFCLISCSSAQECKEGLNLLPMYGNIPKCDEQLKMDKDFISSTTSQFPNRKTASIALVDKAWGHFYKGDLETSMKRFNQAWLLDSLNADVYWGFGNLLGKKGEFKTSISYFEKSLKIDPNNAKVYEGIATSYGQLFFETKERGLLDKSITALYRANGIDKNNPRILSQLTAAYSYFMQKDSAYKYLKLTDKIDPKTIHPEVRAMLTKK